MDEAKRTSRTDWTLETIYGSVPPLSRPEDWEQRIQEAKQEHLIEGQASRIEGEADTR